MTIALDCPRCQTHLRIPNRLAGSYVNCQHCKGRLWVEQNAATDELERELVGAVAGGSDAAPPAPAALRPATSPAKSPSPKAPGPSISSPPAATPTPTPRESKAPSIQQSSPTPTPAPSTTSPAPRKKTARFVSDKAVDSTLRFAADGKLPELRLSEDAGKKKQESALRSNDPLVMVGALSISLVASFALVMMQVGPSAASGAQQKAEMRQLLKEQYFGAGDLENGLEPYQLLLREAQRAHSRGDRKTECRNYRKVVDLLHAEGVSEMKGVTGSRSRDKALEDALSVLLSGAS
jgi:hypothetical protein